jgi:gamma-glutamyltranspeptidase/glutathione hydrolase
MARTRAVAAASEAHVADAATALLAKGNAVDAVVAGVFAAAAGAPGVLLGPVQILFGGAGLGLRAVDGRVRQAGKGAPRPRGFTEDQLIAPAARVGVPALPAALAAALASSGASTLAQVMAPAIALAEGPRRDALKRIAQRGPSALLDEALAGELVNSCGRVAGGLLSRDDIDAVLPAIVAAGEGAQAGRAAFVPWRSSARGAGDPKSSAYVQIVAASDHRGLVAVAAYERRDDGVAIAALSLVAPFMASPVLRGQPRVKPGEPAPSSAPIALVRSADGAMFDLALGIANDGRGEDVLDELLAAFAASNGIAPSYAGEGALIGVARGSDGASILARR